MEKDWNSERSYENNLWGEHKVLEIVRGIAKSCGDNL
jgi:hypothetical protein